MLSLRAAKKEVKKKVYLQGPDASNRPKEDTMFPTDHSKAVQVTHDYLSDEQIGQGTSNVIDRTLQA